MFRGSFKLFTIRGIEIRIDYSWFIIFILVTWSMSAQYFPMKYKEWSTAEYWAMGMITSVLFFASVLFHELSHSFVAMSKGIKVPRITLFIFGGAAEIAEEPREAGHEFIMAFAGPASSVVLGVVSAGLWLLFESAGIEQLAAIFNLLAYINIMLAFFNLIPGFPLDGGRVLRALIWGATGDLAKATRIAGMTGRAVAFFFIIMGIFIFFSGGDFQGLWLAFIGWFLLHAATQSTRHQLLRNMLAGHTAQEVMWTDCPFVDSGITVSDLVNEHILKKGRRCFPVIDGGRVSGIVTVHNVKELGRDQWPLTAVGSIMIPAESLRSVRPDTPLPKVMEMMSADGVNQVPVVRDGRFLGMVSRDGIMDFLQTQNELGLASA